MGDDWDPVIELGNRYVGAFEIAFVVLPAVLRNNFFGFGLARLKKLRPLDQGHKNPFDCLAVGSEITLRCDRANVWKLEALLKIGCADQDPVRHALCQLADPRRRRKACDPAGAKRYRALGRAADLENRHVLVWLQPESFDQRTGRDIGRAADPADADAFSLQILCGADSFLHDEL